MEHIKRFNEAYGFDQKGIREGVYDITGIDYLSVDWNTKEDDIENFKKKYPDGYQCNAYGVDGYYLLSEKPTVMVPIDNRGYPNFEGHGTLTVIDNCPRTIIIIGQND